MVESSDTIIVGILLVLIGPLLLVEYPAYSRGGYTSAFWSLPRDDKLDHIGTEPAHWVRLGANWIPMLTLAVAGLAGFAYQLAAAGGGTLAWVGLGAYLFGAVAWLVGVLAQSVGIRIAAELRRDTGTNPDWVDVAWTTAWWSELTYVLVANLAFIAWGIAILDTGFPAEWVGWTAVLLGALAIAMVGLLREAFPQLGVLVPIVLGVALLLH